MRSSFSLLPRVLAGTALTAGLLLSDAAVAQTARVGSVSPASARRLGLERAWSTAIEMNRARDRVIGTHVNVSPDPQRERLVLEIRYNNRTEIHTDRDVNKFGEMLGKPGIEKLAVTRVNELKQQNITATAEQFVIPEVTLFTATANGWVQAIDGRTGATRWSGRFGNADYVTYGPAANDEYVAICNGKTLYVLEAETGKLAWEKRLTYVAGAGPAMSAERVFMPTTRGVMESFDLRFPKFDPSSYHSLGHALVRPLCTPMTVSWPTDRGHLYVGEANATGIHYRLQAKANISAPSTYANGKIFCASNDGYVYAVKELSGEILWAISVGEIVDLSPIPVDDHLYVTTASGNLACVSIGEGRVIWWAKGVRQFVAASETRIYGLTPSNDLVALNPQNGSRLGIVPLSDISLAVENYQTDRMYFITRTGTLVCVHESELSWPVRHVGAEGQPVPRRRAPVGDEQPPVGRDPMPPDDAPVNEDPFGGNPFGAPAAKPAPAGNADPFGTGNPFDTSGNNSNNGGATTPDDDNPF